jgi:hypothetical protein
MAGSLGRFIGYVRIATWVIVMIGITAAIVTPFLFRRGPYAHPDDPRLGVRQKTPWILAVVLVSALIVAPLSFAGVVSSRHPRNEALYLRTLYNFDCFSTIKPGCKAVRSKRPLNEAMRHNPGRFIAAGDEACEWLESRPFLFDVNRAQSLQDQYVNQKLGAVEYGPKGGSLAGNYRMFFQQETRAAWEYLCRSTLETRTLWPIRTWKDHYND